MKKKNKIGFEDYIKANRIASRELQYEKQNGWVATHKVHKSNKTYNRKDKNWKSDFCPFALQ